MKGILTFFVLLCGITNVDALIISEILSNPIGTDNGREWIELYNDTSDPISLASLSLSTSESGAAVSLTPLQGGTVLPPEGYAVIATIVSGQTKFLEDYPSYNGMLLRVSSTFSLTNASAALYVRSGASVVASLPSYTAASEGKSLSFVHGSYVTATPTPGAANEAAGSGNGGADDDTPGSTAASETGKQTTVPQMSPPSPDIVIYMLSEKIVVAGAESEFSATSATRAGKEIHNVRYAWAFGDGGHGTGSSTKYRYAYNGRYVAIVEATSPTVAGSGRMIVRVVAPDIQIKSVGSGKYGSYIDISNPNSYDLDLSQWVLTLDGSGFPFPKNTLIPSQSTIRFSGVAMGFASTTIATSTVIRIQFPNLEEVTRFAPPVPGTIAAVATTAVPIVPQTTPVPSKAAVLAQPKVLGVATSTSQAKPALATTSVAISTKKSSKDTRIVSWWRTLFGK